MEFDLTETQKLVKQSAREFLSRECPPTLVRELMATDTAYSEELWNKITEQGWTGMIFPEEFGGLEQGMVEMAVALEEMGRALLPGPFLSTVLLSGSLINEAGARAQKERYLAPICRGAARATLALLEESASWDPESIRLPAVEAPGGFTLSGKKLFVPDAGVADFLICAARQASDILLLIVNRQAAGVSIRPMPAIDNTRKLYEVIFERVSVAESDLLARGDAAQRALARAIDIATVGLCAEMVGGMQRVLDTSVEYAKTRKQFGKPIGQFQAVQHQCADMLLMVESARSATYMAAWALNEKAAEARLAISIAKAYCSDAYREVGNRGIQVHGGIGFTWESDLHLFYRRAKASEIMFGDATEHRERIAQLVIDVRV